ncbi:ester cyclase [Pseudalkalibacillus sp. A8]|uniref:ester cyclase n=1 Tax=Pseudalkalibacillus sp. A8 TaxID=3382641 RepID=UPI0038B4D679
MTNSVLNETENQTKATDAETTNSQKVAHEKVFYGDSQEVNKLGYSDYNEFSVNKEKKQSMRGFDDEYLDIIDYIIKCTHRIWEEKGFGLIYTHYSNRTILHTGNINSHGVNSVVSGSIQMQHAFPDRKVVGEDVIWSGNDREGFYTSHRVLSYGTNLGGSVFGPPTGKKVSFRVIADCIVHSNRIVEEWLYRDYFSIVKKLGINPVEVAKKLAKNTKYNAPTFQGSIGSGDPMEGQLVPQLYTKKYSDFEIGDFILEMYNKVWECRLFNYVTNFYADHAVIHYINDQDLIGFDRIQEMIISLFASFPCAKFIIERVTCNQGISKNEWDVSVRWRLQGLHEGIGVFGKPSGKPVEILGASHLKVRDEKIVEEWIVFDAIDVLRQIYSSSDNEFNEDNTIVNINGYTELINSL